MYNHVYIYVYLYTYTHILTYIHTCTAKRYMQQRDGQPDEAANDGSESDPTIPPVGCAGEKIGSVEGVGAWEDEPRIQELTE